MTLIHRFNLGTAGLILAVLAMTLVALAAAACTDGEEATPTVAPLTDEPTPTEAAPPPATEQVSVLTDWVIHGGYSPLLLAVEGGYFAEEGLEVTIQQGGPAAAGMEAVNTGDTDFYYGAVDEIPYDVAVGMDIVTVAAITHGNPSSIMLLSDSPIQTVADLEGRTIGFPLGGGIQNNVFRDVLEANGVDPDQVRVIEVDSELVVSSLLAGQFDAAMGWRNSQFVALQGQEPDARYIAYTELGFDWLGGYAIATGRAMIEERPEIVERFVRAVLRAWSHAVDNPQEAIDAAAKHYPENFIDPELSLRQLQETIGMLEGPETQTYGLGYMSAGEWQDLVDVEAEHGGLEEVFPVETYYTNEFIPAEPILP